MRVHLFGVAVLAALIAIPATASPTASPVIITPAQLKWVSSDQLPPGGKMAVLVGSPEKAGYYVVRIMLPDGAKFGGHFHGGAEYVTVLSGTFMAGIGDKPDMAKALTLPAGSFAMMPAGVHHWAMAHGTTVLELSGTGPMTTTMVKGSGGM